MFEAHFKTSIDCIIMTDNDGNIAEVNPAGEKLLGYPKDELIGQSIQKIYASEIEFNKVVGEIKVNGKFKGRILNKTGKGTIINTLLSANLVFDQNGNPVGMMGISREITEDISLLMEYDQLINTVSDIIYSANIKGVFTYVNQAVTSILGYTPEEVTGLPFIDLIHPDDQKRLSEYYANFFKTKRENSTVEFKVIKKDGSVVWVEQQVSTKFNHLDPTKIEGYFGVVRDIDKRKKTELLLAESEEKYRELFDNSGDLIQSIDVHGNFLYVNRKWQKIIGYKSDELKNMNLFDLIHPDSMDHCENLIQDIINTGKYEEDVVVYSLIGKNGKTIIVEGALSISKQKNEVKSIQTFLRDVTEQRELEAQLAKNEGLLSQITGALSDVFYLYNFERQSYDYISKNCEDILGVNVLEYKKGELHPHKFLHPDDTERFLSVSEKIKLGEAFNIDYRLEIDGKIKWINEKSYPIKNKTGEVVCHSGVCRDVTDLIAARDTIYKKNIEIGSSILYAKRVQESVLPTSKIINDTFPDSFTLYKPKDIVSGDFYIIDHIRTNDKQVLPVFIVGDCTGHGIPGAVLSLMSNVLVRESFSRKEVNSPSEALDFVRQRLIKFFASQDDNIIRDGMDIAFCVHNPETNQIYYSGANIPCLIVRQGELIEIKPDKQHVGYNENYKPYTNHVIDLQKGDCIYLSSDGYQDQFGGDNWKKFTRKRFYKLLREVSSLDMHDVQIALETEHNNWKNGRYQIDDITVMGIRFN